MSLYQVQCLTIVAYIMINVIFWLRQEPKVLRCRVCACVCVWCVCVFGTFLDGPIGFQGTLRESLIAWRPYTQLYLFYFLLYKGLLKTWNKKQEWPFFKTPCTLYVHTYVLTPLFVVFCVYTNHSQFSLYRCMYKLYVFIPRDQRITRKGERWKGKVSS